METILQSLKAKFKHICVLTGLILLALVGWHFWHKHDKKVNAVISSSILPFDVREKIVVDPIKHTIAVTTATGTSTTYLPDRPTAITEDKNGKLSIQEKKFGTEVRPYLGFGSDLEFAPRVHTGVDFFYWDKFDLGTGLAFNADHLNDTRLDLNLSYNFYSNTSVAFSLDNHHVPGLFLKVRF